MGRPTTNGSASPDSTHLDLAVDNVRRLANTGPDPRRPRAVEVRRFPTIRRLVLAAVRAGRTAVPMHGLFEVDLTEARRQLDTGQMSLTAFVVASVGRAAALHPEVHAYRNWRGDLRMHHFVDIATLIEIPSDGGKFGLAHVVRDADIRNADEVSGELDAVKANPKRSANGRKLNKATRAAIRVPGLASAAAVVARRSSRLRRMSGTVSVTSVGMFGGGGGYAMAPPGPSSLKVVVGGASVRPAIIDGEVVPREMLNLTVTFDHNVLDGAPAARFVADLRRIIESAEVLG